MKRRPFLFTFISLLFLLEPLVKMVYTTKILGFQLDSLWSIPYGGLAYFKFWFLGPCIALTIYLSKSWTWPLMVALNAVMITLPHLYDFQYELPWILTSLLSTSTLFYFSQRSIREYFFHQKLRFWERKARYHLRLISSYSDINKQTLLKTCEVINLSESGAFIKTSEHLEIGKQLMLNLTFEDQYLKVPIEIIHSHTFRGNKGYGVRFLFKNSWHKMKVIRLLKRIIEGQKSDHLDTAA